MPAPGKGAEPGLSPCPDFQRLWAGRSSLVFGGDLPGPIPGRAQMELGPCTQMWNYLYVEDAARALAQLLLGKAPAGVYNVAGEDTRPLRSFIEEIYDLCGRKGSDVDGDRPPNAEGVISLQPDLTKLKEAAGWKEQVEFAEGIRRMIKLRRKDSET